ncbi:MAG: hypothetical protein JWP22_1704 [Ramlibacter sp.]|jgi:hypothetical protein|nr:hypothetical protein [Ramlibacter sp.]MDB5913029.1 hypothetical protein [Ramlibacter sp.]
MEITPQVPTWLTLIAAAGIGVFAVAALARMLEAVLDLDTN